MKAIILAAGRGSRLGALTDGRPKGLVELMGRPLLAWQVAALRAGGCTGTGIVRGYRGELLEGFGDRRFDNPRWAETNMVMSLAAAAEWLRAAPCLVSYSDIFYPPEAVAALRAAAAPLAITYDVNWFGLWSRRFPDPLADAETLRLGPGGRILEIGRRAESLAQIEGQYMGLLRFTPESWGWVENLLAGLGAAADRLDMTGLLARLIEAGRPLAGIPFWPRDHIAVQNGQS